MKILASGSSGFIARFLIPALASKGHSIVGIDKWEGNVNFGDSFTFAHGNILDEEIVKKAMNGIDIIIHLAAEHQDFGIPECLDYEVNVEGTKKLLKYAEKKDIKSFIFYSSVAVYGNNQESSHEGLESKPVSPYGKSKLLVEQAIESWYAEDKSRNILIIRPTVIFGPHKLCKHVQVDFLYREKEVYLV